MISFYAKMYNVTDETFYDNQPTLYTIAYYRGNGIGIGDDGTTKTDIPLSDFDFQYSTNIGTHFEFYAKQYFIQNQNWPVLRLCTSNSTTDYFLEWDPSDMTGFNIQSPGKYTRWASSFQFDPSNLDLSHQDYSNVFVSVPDISDLETIAIIWSGAVRAGEVNVETLVSYATVNVSVSNQAYLQNSAGTLLGTVGNRQFVKTYDGPAIYIYLIVANSPNDYGWHGVAGLYPCKSLTDPTPIPPFNPNFTYNIPTSVGDFFEFGGISWRSLNDYFLQVTTEWSSNVPIHTVQATPADLPDILYSAGVEITYTRQNLYEYLQGQFTPVDPIPPSDVDPDDIPPEDEPPTPVDPDDPDPYYDPTSDPVNPDYDPTKDPDSPDYDPDTPHTPWRPISGESPDPNPDPLPPDDTISVPPQPPVFASSNRLLTLYNPVQSELNDLANFLWSPTWSVDTFKKIFANPLDAILGLMVMPTVPATVSQRELSIGNIPTGITMRYFTQQFVDYPCGSFTIGEYYGSYLDYAPYTKVVLMLPFIGECRLNTDEVMNKTVDITYRFDVSTGSCVAFVKVDGSLLYTFNGMAVASIPLSANGWGSMISGLISMPIKAVAAGAALGAGPAGAIVAAAATSVMSMKEEISHTGNLTGSAGLMGIQTPYLIITRPRQVIPANQNSYTGYPSFITESLGSLSGYTEVEQCHLEHIPATGEELAEIEQLLKEGVLF